MTLKTTCKIVPKVQIRAKRRAASALGCFAVLIFALLSFTNIAASQITKTARVELNDGHPEMRIGSYIYVTPDPGQSLTYQVITSRHQNNLRGKRQEGEIINLGLTAAPVWMVFSVTNDSSQEDWILHFGKAFDGRMALAHKLLVRNHTTKATFTRALRERKTNNSFGEDLHGAAIPIKITKGQTELIVMYMEAEGGLPNTIAPRLMTKDAYINMLRFSDISSILAAAFFMSIAGFFMAIAYIKNNKGYLFFLGYYLINAALFHGINSLFFAEFTFTGELICGLYAASTLMGLFIAKFFLGITIEDHAANTALFASGAIIVISTVFNTAMFSERSILDDLLIFLPTLIALITLIIISFQQGQLGKFGAYSFSGAWLAGLFGTLITALSVSDIIGANFLTINAYWLSLSPQSLLFIYAARKKLEMTEQEERHLKSRENRAAQSLARLQQSKESADQARLLRVIERERELMAELREREIQRTEEMRSAKEMADEANRSKSAFLAVVSHEIRTPMTGILGMVRLLGDTKLSKEQTDYAQAIQNSGDTMMALLNDILDFEKIESGNMELEKIDFDILKLVQGVVTLMSGHAEEKSITLQSEISENFPRYLIGDPTRLRQIFLNLVNNAIKFTDEGSVTIQLRATPINASPDQTTGDFEIYFAVKDTGIGIPEIVQDNLFNPFSQAEKSTARKYGGTGLGLAICKRLTEAMRSSLRVESTEGEGSTFFFSALMSSGHEEGAEEQVTAKAKKFHSPAMNILVIEDNEMNRKVLQGFLGKDGHSVTLAESGEKALEIIEDANFDVILTDISLTGMNGMETAKTIRTLPDQNKALTPIIAITGNIAASDIKDYFAAGINGFIAKPIDPEELAEILHHVHKDTLPHPVTSPDAQNEVPQDDVNSEDENGEDRDAEVETEKVGEEVDDAALYPIVAEEVSVSPVQQYMKEQVEDSHLDDYDSFEEAATIFEEQEKSVDDSVFNKDTLQTLLDSLGKEQFSELIQGFATTADDIVAALVALKDSKNTGEIQDRGHELKGMAANFGFTELSRISGDIERALQKSDLDTALLEIDKLPDANQRSKDAIGEWLNQAE